MFRPITCRVYNEDELMDVGSFSGGVGCIEEGWEESVELCDESYENGCRKGLN